MNHSISNQIKASPACQLNLPFDSLSSGEERGKHSHISFYPDKSWLYQKYSIEGLSSTDISQIINCTPRTIILWLNKHKIKVRTPGESLKLTGKNKGSKNTNWRGGKYQIKFKCIECGIVFKSNRRSGDQDRKFCSIKCKNKYQKKFMKELLKNPIYKEKYLKGINFRPTELEKYFDKMTPDIVRYVGDGSWWRSLLNGKSKNPDFKVIGQNKVIELFGDYWHRDDNPEDLINLYKQAGLECLVIWEHEVYNNRAEVLKQVNEFIQISDMELRRQQEREELYRNKDWLYQKYIIEKLSMIKIGKLCKMSSIVIRCWLKEFGIKRETPAYRVRDWLYQKYYVEGLSPYEISELCKVCGNTIRSWLKTFGIRKIPPLYQDRDWLYRKYIVEGLTTKGVGKLCKTSGTVIGCWLKKLEIRKPPPLYQDRDWLYRKYWAEELSTYKIGELCKTPSTVIQNWLKKFGIKARHGGWHRADIKPFYRDKDWLHKKFITEDKSTNEIGQICNVGSATIHRFLRKFGIEIIHSLVGKNNPFYGRKHTEEARKRMSENHADFTGENNPYYDRKHGEETRRKMRKAWKKRKGKNLERKTVNKFISS